MNKKNPTASFIEMKRWFNEKLEALYLKNLQYIVVLMMEMVIRLVGIVLLGLRIMEPM